MRRMTKRYSYYLPLYYLRHELEIHISLNKKQVRIKIKTKLYLSTSSFGKRFSNKRLLFNFIKNTLRRGCSPVNLLHVFRTTFSKNTSGWLFLKFLFIECLICTYVLFLWFVLLYFWHIRIESQYVRMLCITIKNHWEFVSHQFFRVPNP